MEVTTESDIDFATATDNLDSITTDGLDSIETSTNPILLDPPDLAESVYNTSDTSSHNMQAYSGVFEAFIIIEIVMTAIELVLSTVAAAKISKWRRNYRNQMLMQLSVARFLKRMIFFLEFLEKKHKIDSSTYLTTILMSGQMYIDFVIVILVCFFIKHMYDSLIIVIVKISKNNLYSVLCCAWLIPVPVSAFWVAIISNKVLDEWKSYLLICVLIRWPLIVLGTIMYLIVLYKVLTDKIRKFARSLTVVTFFLCLVINFYLFSKDIIKLWCFMNNFTTVLVSYILGLSLNFLILCLYISLITINIRRNNKSCHTLTEYSTANALS